MKQIGIGLMMYTQDYDETLAGNHDGRNPAPVPSFAGDAGLTNAPAYTTNPLGFMTPEPAVMRNWGRDIQPYIKNLGIYVCPDSPARTSLSASNYAESNAAGAGNASYLLNGIASSKAIAAIPAPADIIFVQEYKYKSRVSQVRPCLANVAANTFNQFNHPFYDVQHAGGGNGGGNLLFCDGHAKFKKKTAIMFREFGADMTGQANVNLTFTDETTGCSAATGVCAQNSLTLPAAF
jgi:prepilin-type processing-associated H-X9-DG protein